MELKTFLQQLNTSPENVTFEDTMAVIDTLYEFTPTSFKNGLIVNEPGKNNGSCKIFAFARLHGLTEQQTLNCFGDYYRKDVLGKPDGIDHQNIRNFARTGWGGIEFNGKALKPKS